MRRPRTTLSLALSLLGPIACSGGDGESESTTEPTTGDGTTETTDNTEPLDCGEHLALAGACFEVERHPLVVPMAIVVPGDFDGDGVREYFIDEAAFSGYFGILGEEESGALFHKSNGWLEDAEGYEIMIYRASGLDYDLDGRTDLFALVQRGDWGDRVWDGAFCGLLLRSEPGFEFSIERRLCGFTDHDSPDLDDDRFDGTFADVDGDGLPELFFARSPFRASLHTIHANADADERLSLRQSFDLRPLGLQKNIVTVAADLDGDGRDELVLVDGLGKVWTFGLRELSGDLELLAATETPVLPPMAGTVVAHDLDGDGELDLIGAETAPIVGKLTPGEFAIARGLGDGRFTRFHTWTAPSGPSQTSSPLGPQLSYVHLVVLDLDESGYPALVYVLPDDKTLVMHPQLGRDPAAAPAVLSLDYKPLGVFRDPQADGSVDLLVTFDRDTKGTDDRDDDEGPYIDRYRLHRP